MLFAGVVAATAVIGSLTGCASQGGAAEAAVRYVDLVATAGAEDLESLWAMSVADPDAGRLAGEMLAGAVERIEVLEVGDPVEVEETPSVDLLFSDVDAGDAVQVSVSYELAGEEHDGTVVLAPLEDASQADVDSWRVVTPLMGTVDIPAVPFDGIAASITVSGHALPIDPTVTENAVSLFPGVYDTQAIADPFFTSSTEEVTVLSGAATPLPAMPLEPTDEAVAALQADVDSAFGDCADDLIACPTEIVEEGSGLYPGWQAELVTAPILDVEMLTVTFTGGELLVQTPDGPETWTFSGSSAWQMDIDTLMPTMPRWVAELQVSR